MATEEEVRRAIDTWLGRLTEVDAEVRRKRLPDRIIGVSVLDHDRTYVSDLIDGELSDVRVHTEGRKPQVRLICRSDDLIALTEGELNFSHAWATGRVRLDASVRDLLRLRSLA